MKDTSKKVRRPSSEHLVDGKYSVEDLVDIEGLRSIFKALSELTGVAIGFTSYPAQETLIATAWVDVCTRFHRAKSESAKACLKSNLSLTGKLKKVGDITYEYCDNGLVDGVAPVIINGKHIATLFAGQVFLKKPDIEKFRKQAQIYGYDVEQYLEAVSAVPVITDERFKEILSLLGGIASWITGVGYANLDIRNKNLALRDDVFYREKTEAKIIHLNSILRAVSDVSKLIVKEKDEKILLQEACRILVDSRNYRLVWVGLIEPGTFEIKPASYAGFEDGYLRDIHVTWDDSPSGQGPTGITVRTMKPSIVNDIAADPAFAPWRDEALKRGYRAIASVPVAAKGHIYGVINVYSERPNSFDEQEAALLAESAESLGFAMYAAAANSNRERSDRTLIISEENYRSIFDTANDAIFIQDIDTLRIIDVNQKACEMYLYGKDEMLLRGMGDLSLGESPFAREDLLKVIGKTSSGESQLFEWVAKDKAERLFWVEINLKRAVIGGKYRILAIVRDIADRKRTEERWEKIHEAFLGFAADPLENINRLVSLCGEIMLADFALYNKLEGGILHPRGSWHVPQEFHPPEDSIDNVCLDVISAGSGDVVVVRNLQESAYTETNPSIRKCNLRTYVGQIVKVGDENVGTLCLMYQYDIEPSDEDKEIMGFIAHAISVEEERVGAEETSQMAQFSIERSGNYILWVGPDARILHVNGKVCESLGYSREEMSAMSMSDLDPGYSRDAWQQHWKDLNERGSLVFETQYRRKDGSTFPVEATANHIEFQGSEYSFISAQDITARKAQQEELARREDQLEILSRTSQHVNAILEVPTILRTLVGAAIEIVDATAGLAGVVTGDELIFRERVEGGKIRPLGLTCKPGEGLCASVTKSLKAHISNDVEHDASVPSKTREMFRISSMIGIPILNREGRLLGCLELHNKKDAKEFDSQDLFMLQGMVAGAAVAIENANMFEQRRAIDRDRESLNKKLINTNRRLSQLALKDAETGLHNHHYLVEAIELELYRAKRYVHPLSVIMIDIDYFRSINDLYGHEFGDKVLKQFAIELKKMVRRYDVVVRFGGEEFVVLSSGTDRNKAIALAHRLTESLSIYNFGDNKHSLKLRLSVAVASYPDDPITSGMELIYLAEKLLDKAKEAGGNKVFSSGDLSGGKAAAPSGAPTDIRYLKKKIASLTKRGKQSLMESIFAFAKTIEMRDHYTGEHVDSTVHYSTQIARALKLDQEEIDHIRQAAILHDLGKVGISDKILLKKSKLTAKEFEEIKKHPQIAADIIRPIQFMKDIVPLILHHHEKWDGTGYPAGLKGESIPVGSRIISIADVYQALTSDRPYRKAFSKKQAVKIMKDSTGSQFDPKIVKVFLDILKNEKDELGSGVSTGRNSAKGDA